MINPSTLPHLSPLPASVLEVPYFYSNSLIVAASLTGANVFTELVQAARGWMEELGIAAANMPSESDLYPRVVALAGSKLDTSLSVHVNLWGERHDPTLTGSVSNMLTSNTTMGDIGSAVFRGIMENLRSMMPEEIFQSLQVAT